MNMKYFFYKIIKIIILIFVFLVTLFVTYYVINNKKIKETEQVQQKIAEPVVIDVPVIVENFEEEEESYDEVLLEIQTRLTELDLNVTDRKEWFIGYKQIIEEYKPIVDPPETIYDYYTDDELNLLFRVVQAEIGDEYSFEQKCNVASVIFNRLEHDRFENEMFKILTPDQFSTVSSGRYREVDVSEETILSCEYVFMMGDTTGGCLFFDSNGFLKYEFVLNDGAHNFYKIKGE